MRKKLLFSEGNQGFAHQNNLSKHLKLTKQTFCYILLEIDIFIVKPIKNNKFA